MRLYARLARFIATVRQLPAAVSALRQQLTELQIGLSDLGAHQEARLATLQHENQGLAQRLMILERDHAAQVAWLQRTYPEIVAAIGSKIETEQLHALSEQLFTALQRELAARPNSALGTALAAPGQPAQDATATAAAAPSAAEAASDDAFYLALENRFRGRRAEVQARQRVYLERLRAATRPAGPWLDLGCGRGEWLELLRDQGIAARGVDLNLINGATCRQLGLDVHSGRAEDYLRAQPANQFAVISAFQLVEHLPFASLQQLLSACLRALQPGGWLILETPNPENLQVAAHRFWLDPTHQRPLPPELLEFMLRRLGFERLEILRLNADDSASAAAAAELPAELQRLLFGPRDYALIACKAAA